MNSARTIRLLAPAAMLAASVMASPALATIRECRHPDGSILYTQFDCPPLAASSRHREGDGLSIVAAPELTSAERTTLDALERSLTAERLARKRTLERRARERQRAQAEARSSCAEARRALTQLAAQRRKGYSAASERQLDAEVDHWEDVRRASC